MAQYYYRYFSTDSKLAGANWMDETQVAHFLKYGRVNVWARGKGTGYVAKPRNILVVPYHLARLVHYKSILQFIESLPPTLDLRTVNIGDYPELFI